MIRNVVRKFKALALTLVAVLAMSAVAASAAQAAPVITGSGAVHATGSEIGEQFSIDGITFTCKVTHYTGTAVNGSSTLRVTPTWTECRLGEAIPLTITTHECHYLYHLTQKDLAPAVYTAHMDIECTNGKPITMVSTNPKCKLEINSQTNLTTVEFTNDATDLTFKPNLTGTTATVTEDGFLCPFTGVGVKTGGTYKSTSPITLTAAAGSLQVSGE